MLDQLSTPIGVQDLTFSLATVFFVALCVATGVTSLRRFGEDSKIPFLRCFLEKLVRKLGVRRRTRGERPRATVGILREAHGPPDWPWAPLVGRTGPQPDSLGSDPFFGRMGPRADGCLFCKREVAISSWFSELKAGGPGGVTYTAGPSNRCFLVRTGAQKPPVRLLKPPVGRSW